LGSSRRKIHAGGRGKGSFQEATLRQRRVRLTKSLKKPPKKPRICLGRTLVTHQTGPRGKTGQPHLQSKTFGHEKPNCTSAVAGGSSRPSPHRVRAAPAEGGWTCERRWPESTPEKIISFSVDPRRGLPALTTAVACFRLGLKASRSTVVSP